MPTYPDVTASVPHRPVTAAMTKPVRRSRRQNAAVLVVATAVGLWLGVSAPDVSPTAPPPDTVSTMDAPDVETTVPVLPGGSGGSAGAGGRR